MLLLGWDKESECRSVGIAGGALTLRPGLLVLLAIDLLDMGGVEGGESRAGGLTLVLDILIVFTDASRL